LHDVARLPKRREKAVIMYALRKKSLEEFVADITKVVEGYRYVS